MWLKSSAKYASCWQIFFHDWTICCLFLLDDFYFAEIIYNCRAVDSTSLAQSSFFLNQLNN